MKGSMIMSEPYNDVTEAELELAAYNGFRSGLEWAERYLTEEAGKLFMAGRDIEANLLRCAACTIHQEIEVANVKSKKLFDARNKLIN